MVSTPELKNNLYTYLSAYSRQLVLYDETGKRVMDPAMSFIKIWLGDKKIFVRIAENNDDTTLIVSIVGKRKIEKIRTFIDNLRTFANSNNVLMHLEMVSDGSTPSKIDNPMKESWHEVKKLTSNLGGYKIIKSIPLSYRKNNIIVPIPGEINFGDSIDHTNQSLFSILTDTTQALSQLTEHLNNNF
jgi:hypothetical protein